MVLLVDRDAQTGQALAAILRRNGDVVHVVRNRSQALYALRRQRFDLAIVDLFVDGGGAELARDLAHRVPRVMLCLGTVLQDEDIIEAALGFPVHRKAALPAVLTDPGASSNGGAFSARCRGSRPPGPAASGPPPGPSPRGRGRSGRSH